MPMTDLLDLIVLSFLPPSCWIRTAELLRSGADPASALEGVVAQPRLSELRARAQASVRRAADHGIAPIRWGDASYPVALTTIVDPPPLLWSRSSQGGPDALNLPIVAIVGARAASPYATSVAERIAGDLARAGVVVASGMARGVDAAAHRGALAAGGATVAVVGSGVDVIYPPEHAQLARDIERSGALVSELVPGTPPLPQFFPLRNRIISGLSRAVVVVEAGERSGSLITARWALEQGREVLAVPGNVLTGRNRGGHGLLRDGAKIVESADDILDELGLPGPVSGRGPGRGASPGDRLGGGDDPVAGCLTPGEPASLDAIAERTGLSPAKLLPRLFELELRGVVARVGGGRFVRV
jgi:DNA processing protein